MVTAARNRAAALAIWMNGLRVGSWVVKSGEHRFQYDPEWVTLPETRRLSLSLPFMPNNVTLRGDVVRNYFDNLLPDNDSIRHRLRRKFLTGSIESFDLLEAIGRDCVGAIQILPMEVEPIGFDRIEARPLDDAGVERVIMAALAGTGVLGSGEEDDFRISIAGAQEKTALLFHKGQWCLPTGATPTTHILKLPLGLVGNMQANMHESVENEWLCSKILSAFGLPVAHCDIGVFGARKVLVVERFDRLRQVVSSDALNPGREWIARLPQEDFCQALGVAGERKYESDGGPGMRAILRLLDGSANAHADKLAFIKAQMVFWMLAATDGHAKNFSIFHERGGPYRLTPLYDVISAWPIMGSGMSQVDWHKAKLAMALGSRNPHWKLGEILPRHWDALMHREGMSNAAVLREDVAASVPQVIDVVARKLPGSFPERVAQTIFDGMRKMARRLVT